ncbi:MAG: Asp-tRNA(Asn)/Glu-tRNA(Gln) amidotransferase subunit GatC [Nitrospiraceae bacterium]|nr:Asp-tRNA(Asn)/Glu-tRNA(Gln) amidotransferase subunit GatC [Nitrospiraceae bacterium]
MKISIDQVSRLARLSLSGDEKETFGRQLDSILSYMETLNALQTSDIEATSHVLAISNVVREDAPAASLPREAALRNAPDGAGEFYRVPKIIE